MTNLQFTFKFGEPNASGFSIEAIEMAYTTSSSTLAVGNVIELNIISKFQRNVATVEERSGNPGYISGQRLLLASVIGSNLQLSGYRKEISDIAGRCLTSGTFTSSISTNYVKFMEDINLQ